MEYSVNHIGTISLLLEKNKIRTLLFPICKNILPILSIEKWKQARDTAQLVEHLFTPKAHGLEFGPKTHVKMLSDGTCLQSQHCRGRDKMISGLTRQPV